MFFKCFMRQCFLRRQAYLLNAVLVIILLYVYFQKRSTPVSPTISNDTLMSNGSCQPESFNRSRLNCTDEPATQWCDAELTICQSSLMIYRNLFAITHSVILQPRLAKGKRMGGETIEEVLNQPESNEYFRFEKDFIQLPCNRSVPDETFGDNHLRKIFASSSSYAQCPNLPLINETTIAVNRQDYANIYHTITDLYTVYLLCRFIRRDPKSVRILFLDAHPQGHLDRFWSQLFHSYTRLGRLNSSSLFFRELVWSPPQPKSEIDIQRGRRQAPSFFVDFRQHVLDQFQVPSPAGRTLDCQSLHVFFLLRRNYVAHPRNPSGKVARQIPNEQQVIDELKSKFVDYPMLNVTFGHFEQLTIEQQLKVVIDTDLFVGMHGAGLTHVLFMQSGRTLVELAPGGWQSQTHFELMASINTIHYQRCLLAEGSPSTAQTIFDCIQNQLLQMCPAIAAQPLVTRTVTSTQNTSPNSISNSRRTT